MRILLHSSPPLEHPLV